MSNLIPVKLHLLSIFTRVPHINIHTLHNFTMSYQRNVTSNVSGLKSSVLGTYLCYLKKNNMYSCHSLKQHFENFFLAISIFVMLLESFILCFNLFCAQVFLDSISQWQCLCFI